MNLEIKGKRKYAPVFVYWLNRSMLLEAIFMKFSKSFIKKLEEEGEQIRNDTNSIC